MISLSNTPAPDSADALKLIESARADTSHEFHSRSPEAQREVYLKAYPSSPPAVSASPPAPAPAPTRTESSPSTNTPPWLPPVSELAKMDPWAAQALGEAELARRRQTLGDKNRALRIIDDNGRVRDAPDPDTQPPISVADADLPPIRLPEGASADDPVVKSVRELGVYAEVPPTTLESLISHVDGLLNAELPSEQEYARQSDAVIAGVRQKYGARADAFFQAIDLGRRFVQRDNPELAELLEHPLVQNSLPVAQILAHIGSKGRSAYVRRFGTRVVTRI